MGKRIGCVLKRREVQMRRDFLNGRMNRGFLGIDRRRKDSLFDFSIALDNFVSFRLQKLLQFIEVAMYGIGESSELVRQQLRIGESHHRSPRGLRECAPVAEVGIGKMCVPEKIVVDGVVDSAAIFVAIAQAERSDAEMIEKNTPI